MKVKLLFILSALAIFLLSSCAYEQPAVSAPKVYIVDGASAIEKEPQKTFVVREEDLGMETETQQKRNELNKIRALRDFEDEQEEFFYESKLSNVRRIIDDEIVRGYIPELDNPEFKEVEND